MTSWLPVVSRDLCVERLEQIFQRSDFDAVHSSPVAAAAVAAMIYVGAVEEIDGSDPHYVRPSAVLMMRERLLRDRRSTAERNEYFRTSVSPGAAARVDALMTRWGIAEGPWYGTNTRETLRDDVLRHWVDIGAVVSKADLPTSSPAPRWLLRRSFAELFDPRLGGTALDGAIAAWVDAEMGMSGRLRTQARRALQRGDHAITVELPTGGSRTLEPGEASNIIKGVVEEWAPLRLRNPFVISISEPGQKIAVADDQLLNLVGLSIDMSRLLPDAVIVDAGASPLEVWVIEVVHSDGPIDDARKAVLTRWAEEQGMKASQLRFLTAFTSRNAPAARRRLKDLASGSYAWFLAEPQQDLYFGPIVGWS